MTFNRPRSKKKGFLSNNINLNSRNKNILKKNLNKANYYFKKGIEFEKNNEFTLAIASFKNSINFNPKYSKAFNSLGCVFLKVREIDLAIEAFKKAIHYDPNYLDPLINCGISLRNHNNLLLSIEFFKKAIILNPTSEVLHSELGASYALSNNIEAALNSFKMAIKLNATYPEAHNNAGLIYQKLGELNKAYMHLSKALELNPVYPEALNNIGIVLNEKREFRQAIKSFKQSIKYKPNFSEAHCNLGISLLTIGNYEDGWEEYEYRDLNQIGLFAPRVFSNSDRFMLNKFKCNDKISILSEQGIGDIIQFMRYIPHLEKIGVDISFYVPEKLHLLIKESGIHLNPQKPQDFLFENKRSWIPLLSIPKILKVNCDNPIISDPYLSISKKYQDKWKSILSEENKPIIGINWQGNKDSEMGARRNRSFPLELFSILGNLNQFKLLSLQKGFGSEQLRDCSFKNKFVNCQKIVDKAWDFCETAAIIKNCNLVITSDTSVAHLSGALGQKTWVLLNHSSDWRWGISGEKTFWYKSMRLFRQTNEKDWCEVMKKVSIELNQLLF